jgi:hypothetical protein
MALDDEIAVAIAGHTSPRWEASMVMVPRTNTSPSRTQTRLVVFWQLALDHDILHDSLSVLPASMGASINHVGLTSVPNSRKRKNDELGLQREMVDHLGGLSKAILQAKELDAVAKENDSKAKENDTIAKENDTKAKVLNTKSKINERLWKQELEVGKVRGSTGIR